MKKNSLVILRALGILQDNFLPPPSTPLMRMLLVSNNEHCRSFFPLFPDLHSTYDGCSIAGGQAGGRAVIQLERHYLICEHANEALMGMCGVGIPIWALGTGKRVRVCVWHMKLVLYETVALLIAMLITGHHTSIKVVRVGIFERWGNSILEGIWILVYYIYY